MGGYEGRRHRCPSPLAAPSATGVIIRDKATVIASVISENGCREADRHDLAEELTEARDHAYLALSKISLQGSHHRKDIALNASIAEKGE